MLLAQLRELQASAIAVQIAAVGGGDLRAALMAIREQRCLLELLAELSQRIDRRPVVNLLLAPEWLAVRSALMVALLPFPEARTAVAGELLKLEAGNERG